ncbi:hypothetical protein CERZMDRAFT_90538 [Cercospora zeae-maydis SCOH1-5]|uniref:Molybdopterin cofactor biosynthesis C (MoaC) domain-containing protein n=1 Tax=Cercospora zeae-maydis SCOH1-5 TaxID=717836 RepID=A0A6A6FHP1_9PEZI|nr:hypothetical protein CERZMDRAFT_90538 [Cercospora zeae-maydis SCOH1-5]
MEALTAATAATLTVFDMCKAVDKYMEIGAGRVLYKNGGKSGLTAKISWATEMGAEWFIERGLEVPKGVKMKSNIGEAEKEQEGEAKKEEGEDGDVPRSDSDVENSAKVIRKCVVRRQFRRSIRPA